MKTLKKSFFIVFILALLSLSIGGIQEAKAVHVTCTNCDHTGVWCEVLQKYLMRCTYDGSGCDVSAQKICEAN